MTCLLCVTHHVHKCPCQPGVITFAMPHIKLCCVRVSVEGLCAGADVDIYVCADVVGMFVHVDVEDLSASLAQYGHGVP